MIKLLQSFLCLLLILVLAACSEAPRVETERPYYVASVDIEASMTEAEVIAKYGGSIVLFKPEAGFAVLAFNQEEGELSTLATTSANQDTFSVPEVSVAGASAWGGGSAAWGGGWSAWSGGWSAWLGGFSAWSGAASEGGPASNSTIWNQIKLKEAHAISRNFGEGIVVAVIDTGLDLNHPVFAGRLVANNKWRDYIDNDYYPMEASSGSGRGHGTSVASIILQIAPKAKIMPIRVLDALGKGDTDDVISAIDWAISNGANVINLSLGTYSSVSAMQSVIDYASYYRGVYVIASAGNDANTKAVYPAFWAEEAYYSYRFMSVGSVNSSDAPSSFSNYGASLQYFAPGERIYGAFPSNQIIHTTGTSFATPMFSGAIALALSETSSSYWGSVGQKLYSSTDGIGWRDGRLNVESLIRRLPGFSEPQYFIRNVQSNKCLEVYGGNTNNSANIDQWTCSSASPWHRWRLRPVGDSYQLINVNSGYVVDVTYASTDSGANISQYPYGGGNHQKWMVLSNGDGTFGFRALHSGKCMDVEGGSSADGVNIIQWDCHSGNNQKWRIELVN
ncbi:MAG: S8 family serine peptidase [Deinococcales bacterium]